jgi:multiple sugar transport system ATP-binding protein
MGDRVAVLRRGLLQQFDQPQRLYEQPGNMFVASFIGSPAMNMLEASLERDGDGLVCRVGSMTLTVPAQVLGARPALAGYAGRSIAVGIRPEALDHADGQNGTGGRLRGIVRVVEALGPEQLAHVEIEAKPVLAEEVIEGRVDMEQADELAEIMPDAEGDHATLVARLEASASVRPDDVIELAVDLPKLHFFDLESGATIVG